VGRRTALLAAIGVVLLAIVSQGLTRVQIAVASQSAHQVAIGPYSGNLVVDARTGRAFVASQNGTIHSFSTQSGALIQTVAVGARFHALAIVPRFRRLFVINTTAEGIGTAVVVLDTQSGQLLRRIAMSRDPHGLAVDERTARVFVGTIGGVSVFDARPGAFLQVIHTPIQGVPLGVYLDSRREHLFFTQEGVTINGLVPIQGGSSTVSMIDVPTNTVVRTVQVAAEPSLAALDERTGRLFLVSRTMMVGDMVDTQHGTVIRAIPLNAPQPDAIGLDTRAGRLFLVASGNGAGGTGRVTLLDAGSGASVGSTLLGQYPWSIAVDERQARAYVVSDKATYVLDARTGAIRHTFHVGGGIVAIDQRTEHLIIIGDRLVTIDVSR